MSEWKKVKLKDICSDIIDCVNKTAPVCDYETPYKMLRTSDIRNGQINTEGLKCVSKETFEKWNRRGYLQKGDVIFTREAPVGEVGWLKDPKNLFLGQRLMFFRADNKKCDNRFLFYSLFFSDNKRSIIAKSNGSTVNHLRVPDCENIEIYIPDLHTQQNIASILSRYDSLIENYQKQIKLLEEAAQRLYKEWFVDLHFPGHENAKIVDGVPEGWEKKNLGSIIDYEIGGGWGDETKVTPDHVTAFVIRGTDMNNLENGNLQGLPLRYHQSGNFIARQLQEYDIVFEVSGGSKTEGVAKTFLVLDQFLSQLDYPVICASFCKLIRLKKKEDACYVYDTLKEWRDSGITSQYDKRSASSIVNYRWKDFLSQQDIFVPSEDVLSRYTIISKKNHFMRVDLASQIRLLTEARDRLLPKLMSGEIAV